MLEFRKLPELVDKIGAIIEEEQVCPGIYLLTVQNDDESLARNYYAVLEEAHIPQKAKSYGHKVCGLWLFSLDDGSEEYKIIQYEIAKYHMKTHIPLDEPLRTTAFFAAQAFPEYFGAFPVPMNTSRGFTVRHWILDNGIYWIETDQCEEVLAICYPVWSSELSEPVVRLGERTECDIENTMGYLFYPMQTSCIPLRELMEMRPKWEGTVINKPALMNAICKAAPKYAILINQREQLGKNDGISVLLAEFGMETKPHTAHDFLIRIFPEAGEAFLLLEGRQCNTACGGMQNER